MKTNNLRERTGSMHNPTIKTEFLLPHKLVFRNSEQVNQTVLTPIYPDKLRQTLLELIEHFFLFQTLRRYTVKFIIIKQQTTSFYGL